jgi:hypothetical protein
MYWRSVGTNLHRRLTLLLSKEQAVVVGLCLLSALAFFTRFWAIDHKSLFLDEAVSWRFANASLTNMFDLTAHTSHPPFYFFVLHYWVDVFGNSEAALRAPSAVAGAASIVVLAAIGWRVGGRPLASIAALLLLLNPAHLAASQEARMYALLGLLSLSASGVLASFIIKPSILRFAAYASLMAAVIYTHYSGLMVVGVHGLLFAGYGMSELVRKRSAWVLLAGLATAAVLGLAYIPWLSTFREHLATGVPEDIAQPSVMLVRDASRSLLGLDDARAAWLVFSLSLLGLGTYGLIKRWRDPFAMCVGALALVPVAQILVSIWLTPVFSLRQAAPYAPGLAFVLALGFIEAVALVRQAPRLVPEGYAPIALLGVAMLIVMALGVQKTYTAPSRQDWRSVAADLAGTSEPIILAPGYQWQTLAYYRGTSFGVTPIWSADLARIQHGAVPVPEAQLQRDGILIVQGGGGHSVVPAFEQYFNVEGLKQYLGGITTYSLRPISTGE